MRRFIETFDERAFQDLVERHHRAAYAVARSMLDDDAAAEDAVQEAFVRLIRGRESFDCERPFSPWFYRLLRNACRDALKQRRRRHLKLQAYAESMAPQAPARRPGRDWLECLKLLSPADREVLVLRFVQGLTFRELAAHIGCSEAAAKKRGQRALARLRDLGNEAAAAVRNLERTDEAADGNDRLPLVQGATPAPQTP